MAALWTVLLCGIAVPVLAFGGLLVLLATPGSLERRLFGTVGTFLIGAALLAAAVYLFWKATS